MQEHPPGIRRAPDIRAMSQLYATELQRFIRENSSMLASLVMAQTFDPATAESSINSLHTYFDRCAHMMAVRLQDRAKIDPRLTVRVVFGAVLASVMFKEWLFPPGLADEAAITAAVIDFIQEGIHSNFGFPSGAI
jgi:hypothetical protein